MSLFSEIFSWWNGQTMGMRFFTARRGVPKGEDGEGNRYFEEKAPGPLGHKRRWVLYNGLAESSRVPPEWHGWLHYTVEAAPTDAPPVIKPWEQPHRPNLSGTVRAYHPPGSLYNPDAQAARPRAYEPWQPE